MLRGINHTVRELKTSLQKSWEWRIGYVMIVSFIIARWLGLFSSLELIALDFFLSHRPSEPKDENVIIVLVDETGFQDYKGLTDKYLAKLLETILAADPAVVGFNIFRDQPGDEAGRSKLIHLFETHPNLIGTQKILPPRVIPPLGGVSSQIARNQFGFNDLPVDQDGNIRRVFVGAYLPDETPEIRSDNEFKFSFSFKIAQQYLASQGYSLENFPQAPDTPSFKSGDTQKYTKIPRVRSSFGGYIRNGEISEIQTILNFRSGSKTFTVLDSQDLLSGSFEISQLSQKVIIVGATDTFSPNFLPVVAASNLANEDNEYRQILPRVGILGSELEAHAVSQIIDSVLYQRPLIDTISPLLSTIIILCSGISGIVIGNRFNSAFHNTALLAGISGLLLGSGYYLLCQFGIWIPVLPASSLLAMTGITYIAFYQRERSAISESLKLEEERRKAVERTFNAIHAGPLQTLASLLRNVRDGEISQDYLLENLKSLNKEIRSIGERLHQEAMEDVYFINTRRDIKLDLTHPLYEVFYEVYSICLQEDLPGFRDIKVRSVSFDPFDCRLINLDIKRKLCWFLQESLENVGKHGLGTTRLLVNGKLSEGLYTLCIEDNGPGIQSAHIGDGTKFFYRLETLLKGKISRFTKPTGGTICKLAWGLHAR